MLTPSELYSAADQAILAAYVGGHSGALGYERAINENGLPDVCKDDPAVGADGVVLSGIQRRLPQWVGFGGSQVHLSRKLNRSSDSALRLAPTLVRIYKIARCEFIPIATYALATWRRKHRLTGGTSYWNDWI